MNVALYFAKRYLFSKKSVNAINIISSISVLGVLVSSASLIIILSFYNGLENLILSMYSAFTPELRIEPQKGKGFAVDSVLFAPIKQDARIEAYHEVLQEQVLLRYGSNQYIATLKGVATDYAQRRPIDTLIYDGHFILDQGGQPYAVMGANVQGFLGVSMNDESRLIEVFSPRKGASNRLNPAEEFNMRTIRPSATMIYQQQLDDLMIVPIDFAREVVGEFEQVSAIEIDLLPSAHADAIQREFSARLGEDYLVKNREQQNPTLYKIVRSEKWVIFLIVMFTGMIAIFNIIGSLTMLVIDKKKDISVLMGMGASNRLVRRIFFLEGLLIALIGCVAGLLIGLLVSLSQQYFGWLTLGDAENLVTDVYPVEVRGSDFLLVFITVFTISAIIAYISSRLSVRQVERLS